MNFTKTITILKYKRGRINTPCPNGCFKGIPFKCRGRLPLLEKENPQVTSALVNLGEDLSHWHQALKELTKDLNPQDVTQFQKQSPAVQIYLLEEYLASFPDLQLSRAQFEQLHRIVVTKSNTQQVLKNGYELYKDYHYFEI